MQALKKYIYKKNTKRERGGWGARGANNQNQTYN
jgi:hypothetical protein